MTVATHNLFTPSDKLRQSLSTHCKHSTDIFKHSKLSNTYQNDFVSVFDSSNEHWKAHCL